MAALDFPSSPTLNQTYTANGLTWKWDGTSWVTQNAGLTGTVQVSEGGTGATDSAGARANLGLDIGVDVQAWSADLDAIDALAGTSGFLKKTALDTWTLDTNTYLTSVTKADIGLGSVENTALSTWAGSANITTLGTVATGTWSATAIAVAKGGTGATDAGTARTNLGLAIGTNVQAYSADLAAIDALAGTSGFLKKTATDTWALDTNTYLTGNQSISISGDASGSGTTSISLTLATVPIGKGGTGQTTAAAAFNALSPITTLGDLVYGSAANTASRLAGNTTATKQFLSQTGTGTVSAAPAWSAVSKSDVGLGSVENTALSTWAGSANITTVGTVATGTWSATAIAVAKGGTGATDAATARTNLGLAIGTNVQAWDADLDAIAALAGTSGLLKKTAANTWSLDTSTYVPTNGTGATGSWAINASGVADADNYVNVRVIRNSNTTTNNDGMFIGYGNGNSGLTRVFGGGSTTVSSNLGADGYWVHSGGNPYIYNTYAADFTVRNHLIGANRIELCANDTGNRWSYIDFHGDDTYTDYSLRLLRGNSGANAGSELSHRGTGALTIRTIDAGSVILATASTTRLTIDSGGTSTFTGLITGRSNTATFVDANDTGSISVRGDASWPAVMSFHRTSTYAVNFGLDTDNVLKVGGWSMGAVKYPILHTGNITANVPSGSKVLLNTLTAANSAALQDTTNFTSAYDWYEIVLQNIQVYNTSNTLFLRVQTSGGFQAANYYYMEWLYNAGGNAVQGSTTGIYIPLSQIGFLANTLAGTSGFLRIFRPSIATTNKHIIGQVYGPSSAATHLGVQVNGYWFNGTDAVTGVQIAAASGNLLSGVVKIYGVKA